MTFRKAVLAALICSTMLLASLHGDENIPTNARTKANAQVFLAKPGRFNEFFSAESTPVWQSADGIGKQGLRSTSSLRL